ncbi:MAG: hypothetical protein ACRD8O_18005 [Bryobacteraceae bacterium]
MLRHTIRSLARTPGFTAVAVLTLAFGIGANTAMFSLVNGILLKPLAYRDPDRLVTMTTVAPKLIHVYPTFPISAYYVSEWRKQAQTIEEIALLRPAYVNLTGQGEF